jgi:hypothetical protein
MEVSGSNAGGNGSAATPVLVRRLAPMLVLLVAAAMPYAATLGHGFVWDDHLIISHVDRAAEDGGASGVLAAPFLPVPDVPNNYYRPVVYASYWLDRTLGGGLPRVAHLANVVLHALVSLLVFALARRLFGDNVGAFAAGLVFATHPVHVETVAWVAGRTDILCALFSLGAVLAWGHAISLPPSRRRWGQLASSGFLFALACFSKELSIALPLLLLLFPVPSAGVSAEVRPAWQDNKKAWFLTFLPAAVVVLLVRQAVLHDELGHVGLLTELWGTLLVQEPAVAAEALLRMLRSLLAPWPHNALLTRTDIGIDAVTLLSGAALALLVWIRPIRIHAPRSWPLRGLRRSPSRASWSRAVVWSSPRNGTPTCHP